MGKETLLEKYDLSIHCLDYKYIENCSNVKELERILRILRSGEEGIFPHLTSFCEKKLHQIHPKIKLLHPSKATKHCAEICGKEKEEILKDIKNWEAETSELTHYYKNTSDSVLENNLPPIRKVQISKEANRQVHMNQNIKNETWKKTSKPRNYMEWERFNVDEELKKMNDEEKNHKEETYVTKEETCLPLQINTTGFSEYQCKHIANMERMKGNEAFKAQEFEEAVLYYTRSLSAYRTVSSLNNRGQSYMKLKSFAYAILDFNMVLCLEPNNMKALYRRGIAYKEQNAHNLATLDFQMMLHLDPNNKIAQEQIEQIKEIEEKNNSMKREPVIIEDIKCDENQPHHVVNDHSINIDTKESFTRMIIEEVNEFDNNQFQQSEQTESNDDIPGATVKKSETNHQGNISKLITEKLSDSNTEDPKTKFPPQIASMLKICKSSSKEVRENSINANTDFNAIDNDQKPHTSSARNQILNNGLQFRPNRKGVDFEKPIITELGTTGKDELLLKHEIEKEIVSDFHRVEIKSVNTDVSKIYKENFLDIQRDQRNIFSHSQSITNDQLTAARSVPSEKKKKDSDASKSTNIKSTPFEFLRVWNSMNANKNSKIASKCLECISPDELEKTIGNILDGDLLMGLLRAIKCMVKNDKYKEGYAYLKSVMKIPYLGKVSTLISPTERKEIQDLFKLIEDNTEYRTDRTKQLKETLLNEKL